MKVIWTIDPETRVITVEPVEGYTVEVGQREVTAEQSPYKFKKGDRVRNLKGDEIRKLGATGTVDELANSPFVRWDSADMIKIPSTSLRWCQQEKYLELITDQAEVTEAHSSLVLDELQNPDYSHLIGKWVKTLYDLIRGPQTNEWVKLKKVYDFWVVLDMDNDQRDYDRTWQKDRFDLSDPRDENPDEPKEVRIPFSIEEMIEDAGVENIVRILCAKLGIIVKE
jgi:hypothetical protein